jgi:hypothetical protein
MFLIIVFKKSFKNVTHDHFELFGQEHKFETWIKKKKLRFFFLR